MKKLLVLSMLIFISACSDEYSDPLGIGQIQAVAATIDPGYISGAHSAIGQSSEGFLSVNELSPTGSDVVVASFGEFYYIIDRSGESITKYDFNNPGVVIWQFTTKDSATDTGSPASRRFKNFVPLTTLPAHTSRHGITLTANIINPLRR